MRHWAFDWLTPRRRDPSGRRTILREPSGNRVLGGCHVQPRALSPEHFGETFGEPSPRGLPRAAPSTLSRALRWDLRGTESSGAATCSPEHSLPSTSVGPSGNRVLGGCHVQPRALSPEHLAVRIIGGLGCSGADAGTSPSTFFPVLGLCGSSGNWGARGPEAVAPSTFSRDLAFYPAGGPRGMVTCGGWLAWPRDSGTPGS